MRSSNARRDPRPPSTLRYGRLVERLRHEDASEVRLSDEEVQGVLERLRAAEPSSDVRPTAEDLAEVAGVSPERVVEALAEVRKERERAFAEEAAARKKRLVLYRLAAVALVPLTLVILFFPFFGGEPLSVSKVESHPVAKTQMQGVPGVHVDVELNYHPHTIWQQIVGPNFSGEGSPVLTTPRGQVSMFPRADGSSYGITSGWTYRTSPSTLHVGYEYPAKPESKDASALLVAVNVNGEPANLVVPLPE